MNDTNDFNNELMKMLQEACEETNQNDLFSTQSKSRRAESRS